MSAAGARRGVEAPPAPDPTRVAVTFARALRGAGVGVPVGASVRFAEALAEVGLERRDSVYWCGRATLVRRPEDVAAYDAVFGAFWLAEHEQTPGDEVAIEVPTLLATDDPEDEEEPPDDEGPPDLRPTVELRYSAVEVLAHKDFAQCSPEELAEAERLMAKVRWGGATRRTRRRRKARRRGPVPDLGRTVRRAMRTEGEALQRHFREPSDRPRRVVILCDVSGSMVPYARALLRFLHVAVIGRRRVEAFTIGTRLTRVTRALSVYDPDAALAGVSEAVPDWSGGTRLGEAFREFNDRWGVRGLARGAVVIVLSDGWDRGDPTELSSEMARLSRVAHTIVWANPLKHTPGYAPLVRGMAAALPYVDEFVEGHSVASLDVLAQIVTSREASGRGGARLGGTRHRVAAGTRVGALGADDVAGEEPSR